MKYMTAQSWEKKQKKKILLESLKARATDERAGERLLVSDD